MSNDLDFEAWEAPPPPDGLADAVVARMGGTAVGLAMPDADVPRRRRWVIAASAAAVLVAAGGVWAIVRHREPAPAQNGAVLADRAQHIELGGVSADLDRGAEIHWRRTGDGLDIDQRAGTAVWRVGGDERIVIGATVASIEAAGASLRVEVPMNMRDVVSKTDARVIGASALTAAAVAMVTVVVYDGHVKVSSSGQTVVVQPGTTYTVRPPAPAPVVAVAVPGVPSGPTKLAVLGLDGWHGDSVPHDLVEDLRARAKTGTGPWVLAADSEKELADEKLLHDCANEAPACMAAIGSDLGVDVVMYGSMASQRAGYAVTLELLDVAHKQVVRSMTELIPAGESQGAALGGWANRIYEQLAGDATLRDAPSAAEVEQRIAPHEGELAACLGKGVREASVIFTLDTDGSVSSDAVDGDNSETDTAQCMLHVLDALGFPASTSGGKFTHHVQRQSCDVDALVADGNNRMATADHVGALAKYEEAIACKPQARLYQLAFMASCDVPNATKAAQYWAKLSSADQPRVLQMCVRNGITREQLDPSVCDVDALQQKGIEAEGRGMHAEALGQFEHAIRCQPSTRLYQLAFMVSCNMKSVGSARRYWSKLPTPMREQLKQICVRAGITEDMLDGLPTQPAVDAASGQGQVRIDSVPQAKVLFDGVDSGTTPVLLKALPGKHKVTYVIGGDRYTYPVTVKAGYTETLSKDLQ